jgi:hypothetical protein
MLRTVSFLTLGLLVLTGCPGDDTGTTAGSASAGSTSAGTTTENATDTNPPGTTEVATGSGSADTTEGPSSTSEPGSTSTPGSTSEPGSTSMDSGTTTGGSSDVCALDPATDDDCAMCVKGMCCDELEACDADPSGGCQCFQECAQMNPGIPGAIQCGTDCMVNPLGAGTPTGNLAGCTQMNCGKCLG